MPSIRTGWIAPAAVVLFVAACSSSTSPHGKGAGITIVAGSGEVDTIGSTLTQALVVRVADSPTGGPNVHQVVQFSSIPPGGAGFGTAYVADLANGYPTTFVADSTNAAGEASVQVVLGSQAGPARIAIAVPQDGFVDTASYIIVAGHVAGLTSGPGDTTLYVGKKATLHALALDRAGNPRPSDPVTYSIAYGPVTASGPVITATGLGQASVLATSAGFSDSTLIGVVPAGTLAVTSDSGGLIMFNLDESGFRAITRAAATDVKWASSGTSVVFVCPQSNQILATCTSDLNGNISALDVSDTTSDAWPFFSRDGTWIYYSHIGGQGGTLARMHADGTANATIHSANPGDDYWPSPSPDGTALAYVELNSGHLRILTVATGAVADLGIVAHSPQWSPNSNLIAYLNTDGGSGNIAVAHSDGTGAHIVGSGADSYNFDIDWSPDGQWIVGRNTTTAHLDLINVTTNQVLPLAYTGLVGSPTWQPTSGAGTMSRVMRRPTQPLAHSTVR
jgi:Tol biopolymer transport system component